MPIYSFRSSWTVDAGRAEVYDVLEDVAGYPVWWPEVRAVARTGEDRALLACRSVLPYTLHFEMRALRQDPAAGLLEAAVTGDLEGACRWRLAEEGRGTRLEFTQEVTTPGRALRVLGRVARPLLVVNHELMMRSARRGLAGRTTR